jgi:hypothetical protein
MKPRVLLLLVVMGTLLVSCNWQMPQTVTVTGSPEVYVPSGATVFELDFLDDIAADFGDVFTGVASGAGDSAFTAGEKPEDVDYGVGDAFTVYAELTIGDLGAVPPDGDGSYAFTYTDSTDPINLAEAFGPVPDSVWFQSDPEHGRAWLGTTADPPPEVNVHIWATWTDGATLPTSYSQDLLGTDAAFVTLPAGEASAATFDLSPPLNGRPSTETGPPNDYPRPEDLVLHYSFGTTTDVAGDVDSITIRFEIPFALETVDRSFLDLTDEDEKNELAMDDDIFDRDPEDPDEDLEDFLDALRGSSAELVMKLENTTGFGATLAMVNGAADWVAIGGPDPEDQQQAKQDSANWVVDVGIGSAEPLQQVQLDISAATLDEFIDGVPAGPSGVSQFKPEFLIELPYDPTPDPPDENQFSIKKGAAFNVTEGFLRVQADFDYTYDLEDEE